MRKPREEMQGDDMEEQNGVEAQEAGAGGADRGVGECRRGGGHQEDRAGEGRTGQPGTPGQEKGAEVNAGVAAQMEEEVSLLTEGTGWPKKEEREGQQALI